ncbi:MAG: hypothetical protein KQH63_00370 [Desulfobulbaceae bacterium]|nr:hypothetical protein [Desulfobulbaceae bacterium]
MVTILMGVTYFKQITDRELGFPVRKKNLRQHPIMPIPFSARYYSH